MKKINKLIKNILEMKLTNSANSTTCFSVYQPKTPKDLKKFKK